MTIPLEEKWALLKAHKWLRELSMMSLGDIRANPRKIRSDAIYLLRHWPFDFVIQEMWEEREKKWEDNL
jgi:hypothetical protein